MTKDIFDKAIESLENMSDEEFVALVEECDKEIPEDAEELYLPPEDAIIVKPVRDPSISHLKEIAEEKYKIRLIRDNNPELKNRAFSGGVIVLGEFDNKDNETAAFFHELAHELWCKIMEDLGSDLHRSFSFASIEGAMWELGFNLAHIHGYDWEFGHPVYKYAYSELSTYFFDGEYDRHLFSQKDILYVVKRWNRYKKVKSNGETDKRVD